MIGDITPSVTYRGDGNTTVFPFSFAVSGADNIHVAIYDTATERTTELSRDYFVDVPAKTVHYPGYAPGQAPPLTYSLQSCRMARQSRSTERHRSISSRISVVSIRCR